jgi:DNA-binding MurR/RpiR family transcriptional regulator
MPDSFDQLAALIRARFSELSPQFQMGAAFLLDHPDEVAVSSMRKVAERAQVQPASLVRLSQQLGFPGWNELRNLFVARVRSSKRHACCAALRMSMWPVFARAMRWRSVSSTGTGCSAHRCRC